MKVLEEEEGRTTGNQKNSQIGKECTLTKEGQ